MSLYEDDDLPPLRRHLATPRRRRPPIRERDDVEDARFIEGTGPAKAKLVAWLEKEKQGTEIEGEVMVYILQVSKEGGEMPVNRALYDLEEPIPMFVDTLIKFAVDDAQIHRGVVHYAARIQGVDARETFELKVPKQARNRDDAQYLDEFPNEAGLAHQTMRHLEEAHQTIITLSGRSEGLLLTLLRDQREENLGWRERAFDQLAVAEDLKNMKFARDMKAEEVRVRRERADMAIKAVGRYGPQLLSQLLGVPLPPGLGAPPGARPRAHGQGPGPGPGPGLGPQAGPRPANGPLENGGPFRAQQQPQQEEQQRPGPETEGSILENLVDEFVTELEEDQGAIATIGQAVSAKLRQKLFDIHMAVKSRREAGGAIEQPATPDIPSGPGGGNSTKE